jgi:hypothetical protein
MAAKRKRPSKVERPKQELKPEIAMSDERLRVCEDAKRSVSDLIRLSSDGNTMVVCHVFIIAQLLVDVLNSIVKRRPELGRLLAQNVFRWPAFISRKRQLRQANEELLNTLQLGEGGIFSVGEWHLDTPSTRAALGLFYMGLWRAAAGQGPLLSRENKKEFFDDNWNWQLANGYKPELSDMASKLRVSKAKNKPKFCKQLRPATQLANVRSEIKARVWRAFDKIIIPREVIPLAGGNEAA